jgi:hypothetical protein
MMAAAGAGSGSKRDVISKLRCTVVEIVVFEEDLEASVMSLAS